MTTKEDFVILDRDSSEADVSKLLSEISRDNSAITTLKDQKKKLDARIASAQGRIDKRRQALSDWMVVMNHKTLRLPEATLSMAVPPAKPIILDEDKLPLQCFKEKVVRSVDKDMVKALLLTGEQVDGATMSNQAPELRIKF